MKTLIPSEYNSLPENEKRYWKERRLTLPLSVHIDYIPVTISLLETERVIMEAQADISKQQMFHQEICDYDAGYLNGIRYADATLTTALTKLKKL